MTPTYDATFVVLSVVVAILASFAALDLAGRVRSRAGSIRVGWIAGGATVMGLGIWSMHFVGMLAFHLPVPIWYHVPLMLLSVAVAIAASLLALTVINRPELGVRTLVPGGVLMGTAIAGMHYIGMASMRVDGRLSYAPPIVALSILIAIVASLAALWLAFRFRSDSTARGILLKVLSAVVMGAAISGMHYTAMAAARFAPSPPFSRSVQYIHILASGQLGGAVVVSAIVIIVLALIGAVIDRKMQARAAFTDLRLQSTEHRLIQILEAVPMGIVMTDHEAQSVFANAAAKKILGDGIVPGIALAELARIYQAYVAGTDQLYPVDQMPLVRALSGEAVAVDDMEIRRDGRVISVNVQGAPISDRDGNVVAAVAAYLDTTSRRSLEAKLLQSSKMEAVGQLAGGVAHDFNNLLTVIMMNGALLLDRIDQGDPNREDVEEITAAAERAAGLTRQLLAFSRKQVMQPQVINMNAIITDIEKMLRRVIGEDIELQTSLDPAAATINADPSQLEQVLMNLVVNARDALPKGGRVTISTSNSKLSTETAAGALQAPDGDYVMLAVSDTGVGITREVQQRVFDPFFTTKEHGQGTGLGLSTVYGIVKQSGGEIVLYSEVGKGTTFKVYFPRFTGKGQERPAEVAPAEVQRGSETLLLVEDDAKLRELTARVLKNSGYEVLVASGGLEALAIASNPQTLFDAVITDVVMPDINGRELVERLEVSRPGLCFLLMSGYTDDDILRRGVFQGETAFLQKPFTPEQLTRKVREVVDRGRH